MAERKFAINWSGALQKISQTENKNVKDERFFVPEFNKTGTSETVIRFLPAPDTDVPYVEKFHHYFENGKMKFFNNCPTTIKGMKCPVCEYNSAHWDTYTFEQRKRKRQRKYFTNILIIKDPLHPENNGKVFLFAYGVKIHEKIMERLTPPADSIIDPINVWDYYDGANFKLIIKKIDNAGKKDNNYDSASFEDHMSAIGDDDAISKVHNQRYPIMPIIAPSEFKSETEIAERLQKVLGNSASIASPSKPASNVSDITEESGDIETIVEDEIEIGGESIEDLLREGN